MSIFANFDISGHSVSLFTRNGAQHFTMSYTGTGDNPVCFRILGTSIFTLHPFILTVLFWHETSSSETTTRPQLNETFPTRTNPSTRTLKQKSLLYRNRQKYGFILNRALVRAESTTTVVPLFSTNRTWWCHPHSGSVCV